MMLCDEILKSEIAKLDSNYFFEFKYDGERAYIYIESNRISKIINRRGYNILKQFPEFQNLAFTFKSGIIDSEIIVVANGKSKGDFNEGIALRTHIQDGKEIMERASLLPARIVAFDLLELNGENLKLKPLWARKEKLYSNVIPCKNIEVAETFTEFNSLWAIVEQEQLEGLIAKHKNTAYESVRSKYWLKIKNWKEEVVEFNNYEVAESDKNPLFRGITLTNPQGIRCSCLGRKSESVKEMIEQQGSIKVVVQYLEKTKNDKNRFITFKEVVK